MTAWFRELLAVIAFQATLQYCWQVIENLRCETLQNGLSLPWLNANVFKKQDLFSDVAWTFCGWLWLFDNIVRLFRQCKCSLSVLSWCIYIYYKLIFFQCKTWMLAHQSTRFSWRSPVYWGWFVIQKCAAFWFKGHGVSWGLSKKPAGEQSVQLHGFISKLDLQALTGCRK